MLRRRSRHSLSLRLDPRTEILINLPKDICNHFGQQIEEPTSTQCERHIHTIGDPSNLLRSFTQTRRHIPHQSLLLRRITSQRPKPELPRLNEICIRDLRVKSGDLTDPLLMLLNLILIRSDDLLDLHISGDMIGQGSQIINHACAVAFRGVVLVERAVDVRLTEVHA